MADQDTVVRAPAHDEADMGGVGEQGDVAGEGVGPGQLGQVCADVPMAVIMNPSIVV